MLSTLKKIHSWNSWDFIFYVRRFYDYLLSVSSKSKDIHLRMDFHPGLQTHSTSWICRVCHRHCRIGILRAPQTRSWSCIFLSGCHGGVDVRLLVRWSQSWKRHFVQTKSIFSHFPSNFFFAFLFFFFFSYPLWCFAAKAKKKKEIVCCCRSGSYGEAIRQS